MSNSLYEQLKAGTSAEDIAAAFAAELNKAEEQIRVEREAEERAKAEEKAKAERVAAARAREAQKIDEYALILRDVVEFLARFYPSFGVTSGELTEEEFRALAELLLLTLDLEVFKDGKFKMKSYAKPIVEVEADKPVAKPTLDDPFADFFKTFGL